MQNRTARPADITLDDAKLVTIKRSDAPALRFKGTPIVHCDRDAPGLCGQVTLWECRTGGFVIHLELDTPSGERTYASRVATSQEGAAFLESLADKIEDAPEPKLGRGKLKPVGDMAALLLARSRNLTTRSALQQLIAEASIAFVNARPDEFRDQ